MRIKRINQHNEYKPDRNDFDYVSIHQEWSLDDKYLAFYIVLFGFGVEVSI